MTTDPKSGKHATYEIFPSKFNRTAGEGPLTPLMYYVLASAPGNTRPQPMSNEFFLTKEALERRGLVRIDMKDVGDNHHFVWKTTATGRAVRVAKAKELNIKKYSDWPKPKPTDFS